MSPSNTLKMVLGTLLLGLLFGPAHADEKEIGRVLDDFHLAASQADAQRYFDHFAPEGVFLGTDGSERWSVEEFRAYALPSFKAGKGWTYRPSNRHINLSPDGQTAWFDEALSNEHYGATRGSGVLRKVDNRWKVCQYNLSVPVPNELLPDVVRQIRNHAKP